MPDINHYVSFIGGLGNADKGYSYWDPIIHAVDYFGDD
jgi:hypothetical protein